MFLGFAFPRRPVLSCKSEKKSYIGHKLGTRDLMVCALDSGFWRLCEKQTPRPLYGNLRKDTLLSQCYFYNGNLMNCLPGGRYSSCDGPAFYPEEVAVFVIHNRSRRNSAPLPSVNCSVPKLRSTFNLPSVYRKGKEKSMYNDTGRWPSTKFLSRCCHSYVGFPLLSQSKRS